MKKFFKEFKEFISRGNVVDMAVGVIIGGAFSSIVTALTNKIIMPFINWILSAGGDGGNGLEKAYTFLRKAYDANGELDLAKSIYIDWGAFITAIINFFLIALVLFLILKACMKANALMKEAVDEINNKSKREEKRECRAKAKAENRAFKEVWAEYQADKKAKAEENEKAKAEEEAKKKAEEEATKNAEKNKEEELLSQIRDLLAQQITYKN